MKILFKKDNGQVVDFNVREDQLSSVLNIAGMCRLLDLPYERVKSRINRGWHPLLALSTSESEE
ncbi:hypothetical protein [Erwinia mallotivora]|uniref:Uncharacterized protein n=1 Tax=Erwinia mallotivora TaxID=69222 RepID=A0A014N3A6_9GAMM|nr:hypothetical protein [Erwinia mallotivora]EXU73883.1 hypothetical protein BG55_20480 [Erwinia mallotivora]